MDHLSLLEVSQIGDVVVAWHGAFAWTRVVAKKLPDGVLNEELLMEADSALLQILLDGGAKYPGERPVVAQREALLQCVNECVAKFLVGAGDHDVINVHDEEQCIPVFGVSPQAGVDGALDSADRE